MNPFEIPLTDEQLPEEVEPLDVATATPEEIDKWYLRNLACPCCKSEDVYAPSVGEDEQDGDSCSRHMVCSACDAQWHEVYNLVGITNITPGDAPEEKEEDGETD